MYPAAESDEQYQQKHEQIKLSIMNNYNLNIIILLSVRSQTMKNYTMSNDHASIKTTNKNKQNKKGAGGSCVQVYVCS